LEPVLNIQGIAKIMETLDNVGIKLCVGCTKRALVLSIFCFSFVCLRCVVLVSMHCGLCF